MIWKLITISLVAVGMRTVSAVVGYDFVDVLTFAGFGVNASTLAGIALGVLAVR